MAEIPRKDLAIVTAELITPINETYLDKSQQNFSLADFQVRGYHRNNPSSVEPKNITFDSANGLILQVRRTPVRKMGSHYPSGTDGPHEKIDWMDIAALGFRRDIQGTEYDAESERVSSIETLMIGELRGRKSVKTDARDDKRYKQSSLVSVDWSGALVDKLLALATSTGISSVYMLPSKSIKREEDGRPEQQVTETLRARYDQNAIAHHFTFDQEKGLYVRHLKG